MIQSYVTAPRVLEFREVPVPEPGEGELVVAVEQALTCGTDLKTFRRGHVLFPFPTPFGHEFAGRVARVGRGASFSEGDPVCVAPSGPCGTCSSCRRGLENLCDDIRGENMAWGAFAEYVRVPARVARANVIPRPTTLDVRRAAFLEPLACVVNGVRALSVERAESAVVLGVGPIGLLFIALLKQRGVPRVIAVGKHAPRLAAARELGADELVDAAHADAVASVRERTEGDGAAAVVECVGRSDTWEQAVAMTRKGGEVLFYGGCAAGVKVPVDAHRVHYEALTLKGAFHFTPRDVRESLDLLARGAIPVAKLVTGEFPLERLADAISVLESGNCLKLAIDPGASA